MPIAPRGSYPAPFSRSVFFSCLLFFIVGFAAPGLYLPKIALAADLYMFGGGGGAGVDPVASVGTSRGGGAYIDGTMGKAGDGGNSGADGTNPGLAGAGAGTLGPNNAGNGGQGSGGSGFGAGAVSGNVVPASADGGSGGSVSLIEFAATAYDTVHLAGGQSGTGSRSASEGGGKGGDGGDVAYGPTAVSIQTLIISGGNGQHTVSDMAQPGRGGNVLFSSTGSVALSGNATITSGSGINIFTGTALGGNATFSTATLFINGSGMQTIALTKNIGTLSFAVNWLELQNSVTFNLTGTSAAGARAFIANLSGGHLLSINNSAGDMTVDTLNVTGQGRLYIANGGRQVIGALNTQNADLTFVLPAGVVAGQTIVSVDTANITGATIGVDDSSGRVNMTSGQSVKLIAATAGITGTTANLTVQTPNGDVFTLQVSGNDLLAILQQIAPTSPAYERLKAFAEGRSATLLFVNQGQDVILNQGFGSALAATAGPGYQFAGFGGLSGGWLRGNTGSHVDVSGASLLTGLAVGNTVGMGRLTAGLFFEGGWGNYSSYNSFSNAASVKGDGDTSYLGGGILARWEFPLGRTGSTATDEATASAAQDVRPSLIYVDASARMGRAKMDFSTGDIRYNGTDADFDSSSWYYGAHAGLGYQWSFSDKAMLDLSAKLLWTRQQGDSVNVRGDDVSFKDADSLRTRLGGRFNYAVSECITPYVGAYWEHEFDGRQRSSVNGIGIDAPSLKGDTGVGELGLTVKPVRTAAFPLILACRGIPACARV